jgi:23S rRNA pseudouridine2605 synthase
VEKVENRRPAFRQEGEQAGERQFRPKAKYNTGVYSQRKRQEYAKNFEDPTKPIRLNKYLANAGICSRREADDFIMAGVITVNGEVVDNLGAKVLPTDKVMFHNQPVRRERKVYILLNKPKNTVTTTDDPQERHTVLDIVRNACAERIYPVGRLDRNTTGVLLLTNDGDLAAKLTHPKFGKKKIYAVTLDRDLDEIDEATLRAGVTIEDERIAPDALEFPQDDRKHIGIEIHSGQNRVVRRMFEKVGYKVTKLDRVSFAGLTKKNVARGKYRFLTPKEVAMLQMGAFE